MLKIYKIKPTFNHLLVTKNIYSITRIAGSSLIDASKTHTIKEYQTVVDVGPMVKDIKVGDIVIINPKRYMLIDHHFKPKDENNIQQDNMHAKFDIPTYSVYDREDGSCRELMYIYDSDVECVVDGEEFDETPDVIAEDNKILLT